MKELQPKSVWLFSIVTVGLTLGLLLLPLPALVGPVLVVFIPTLVAVVLIGLTEGKSQVHSQLFSQRAWKSSLKWIALSLGMAFVLRLGVSLLGLATVPGYSFQPGAFSPLLLTTLVFAAGEEIGWRGYALPRVLERRSPLAAALLLAIPWAALHLGLLLPGRMLEGVPPVALILEMMSLGVLTSWAYLGSGRSLLAPVLLHGGQNIFVILNDGLAVVPVNWLMAAVYTAAAVAVILATRGRLGERG